MTNTPLSGPITLGGVPLQNRVLPASGTFGLGHRRVFDIDRLGALVPKTVMPEPRPGHPAPRLAEAAGGLINAIGIPTVGISAFVRDELPAYLAHTPPVIVSISAGRPADFAALCETLAQTGIAAVEINLSCPNLEGGGHLFAADPAASQSVVTACRQAVRLPLWAKLSPAASSVVDVARACEAGGANALICGNTMPAMALDAAGEPRLSNRTGGLSGAPIKPIALRIVDEVARAVSLAVIGCGGVASLADALDYFAAGAGAVAVGTATLSRPTTMVRLIEGLAAHGTGVHATPVAAD